MSHAREFTERGARRRAAIGVALGSVLLLLAPGCVGGEADADRSSDDPLIVFGRVPRGRDTSMHLQTAFRTPFPPGSQVRAWRSGHPASSSRLLSEGLAAAGGPSASPDGTRVLFVGREDDGSPWRVYETASGGGTPRPVTSAEANASGAAYLPGERIVFSSDREGRPDPRDGGPAYSLWIVGLDGEGLERLTHGPSSEIDPIVMDDGRILYSAWQAPGVGRPEGGWALFTIRNDGTGVLPFTGSHDGPAIQRRPRSIGGRVAFVGSDGPLDDGRLLSVAIARPLGALVTTPLPPGLAVRSAEAGLDGRWLVSLRSPAGADDAHVSYGLHLLDPEAPGETIPLLDEPEWDEVDAVVAAPRTPPRGHISMVQPEADGGEILCLDARDSDGALFPGTGSRAVSVEVYRATARAVTESPGRLPDVLVARADLAADGSFHLEVPADVPLRVVTRDADGNPVLDSGHAFWVRPGEKRACIGCHEDRERAPENRFPLALTVEEPTEEKR